MDAKDRLWSLAAGVLAVGLGAGAWFGMIGPELATTAAARDELADVESLNQVHELRLVALEQEMAGIDGLRAERDALAEGIPGEALYSDFLREVDRMAAESAVALQGVTSGDAVAYAPPVVEQAAAAPAPEEGADATAADASASGPGAAGASAAAVGGEGVAAPEAAPGEDPGDPASAVAPFTDPRIGPENLAAVPFTILASGDTGALAAFLERLQGGSRIVSITSATFSEGVASADGLTPATGSAQIVGYVYVLRTGAGAPTP